MMPGVPPSLWGPGNLVPHRTGLSSIDVYADVLVPERAARIAYDRERDLPEGEQDLGLLDRLLRLTDREARRLRDGEISRRLPGGQLDQTWAINQATGARWDQGVTENHKTEAPAFRPDPNDPNGRPTGFGNTAIPERLYELQPRLPSYNRFPGTIFLPAGDYYIFGTIRLFGGQQLIGASAADGGADGRGTRLIKVGRGPCIKTVSAADLIAQPELDETTITDRLYIEGQGRVNAGVNGPLRLSTFFPVKDGVRYDLRLTERQRESCLVDVEGLKAARVVIRNLQIVHADGLGMRVPSAIPPVQPPAADAYARPFDRPFRLVTDGWRPDSPRDVRWRPEPFVYDGGAIEVNDGLDSLIEDLVIRGFPKGFGISSRVRAFDAGAFNGTSSNFRAAGVEIRGFGSTSGVSSKIGPPAEPAPEALT